METSKAAGFLCVFNELELHLHPHLFVFSWVTNKGETLPEKMLDLRARQKKICGAFIRLKNQNRGKKNRLGPSNV